MAHEPVAEFKLKNFQCPAAEDELRTEVRRAYERGAQLRVRGAGHSVFEAIYTDHFDPMNGSTVDVANLMLHRYRHFSIADGYVDTQAGRNLGADPTGPPEIRSERQGLGYQLHEAGWALPVLGGISHQTVSGFLCTGSAGASVMHSLGAALEEVTLIDGTGTPRTIVRGDELFPAAGVSLGLLGVLSRVKLRLEPTYGIEGEAITQHVDACDMVDLFGGGSATRPSLERFFRERPYARLMWWPQRAVRKVVIWHARRVQYPDPGGGFERRPYRQLGAASPVVQRFVHLIFTHVLPQLPDDDAQPPDPAKLLALLKAMPEHADLSELDREATAEEIVGVLKGRDWDVLDGSTSPRERVLSSIINTLIKEGTDTFRDTWWQGLPHDNEMSDRQMPILFTELWVPLTRASEVMMALRDHFNSDERLSNTGELCTEIYAAPRSEFWMSPAYDRDVLRIDPFVFWRPGVAPDQDFFPRFWNLLKRFDFRFHWGKALSEPASETGVSYRAANNPHWRDFLSVRKALDPKGIFLTDYWRAHLGIV